MKVLMLGGTRDSRLLAAELFRHGHDVVVSTLTEYGATLALQSVTVAALGDQNAWKASRHPEVEDGVEGRVACGTLSARCGALEREGLLQLLRAEGCAAVVDAAHPYAVQIRRLAQEVCQAAGIPYFRWERTASEIPDDPLIRKAADIPAAAAMAAGLGGRILLTTGSKDLEIWLNQDCLKDKEIFVRVLPTAQVLAKCEALGLKPQQIVAAQGPFSQEWNAAMCRQLQIEVMVAKESGVAGGTPAKIQACLSLRIPLVLVARPVTNADKARSIHAAHVPPANNADSAQPGVCAEVTQWLQEMEGKLWKTNLFS